MGSECHPETSISASKISFVLSLSRPKYQMLHFMLLIRGKHVMKAFNFYFFFPSCEQGHWKFQIILRNFYSSTNVCH